MLMIALVMLLILALAALVMTFAAYPHRGEDVPRASWLGEAMNRAVGSMPTVDNVDGVPSEPAPRAAAGDPGRATAGDPGRAGAAAKGRARAS